MLRLLLLIALIFSGVSLTSSILLNVLEVLVGYEVSGDEWSGRVDVKRAHWLPLVASILCGVAFIIYIIASRG